MKAIIGKKVGMSQIFDENGHVIPVTVIEAGPCVVVQKKTSEKEGASSPSPRRATWTRPAWLPRSTCGSSTWRTLPS